MNKIYLLVSYSPSLNFNSIKYFETLALAQKALNDKKNEIKYKPFVSIHSETDLMFDFTLGWEEAYVAWKILEKDLITK